MMENTDPFNKTLNIILYILNLDTLEFIEVIDPILLTLKLKLRKEQINMRDAYIRILTLSFCFFFLFTHIHKDIYIHTHRCTGLLSISDMDL